MNFNFSLIIIWKNMTGGRDDSNDKWKGNLDTYDFDFFFFVCCGSSNRNIIEMILDEWWWYLYPNFLPSQLLLFFLRLFKFFFCCIWEKKILDDTYCWIYTILRLTWWRQVDSHTHTHELQYWLYVKFSFHISIPYTLNDTTTDSFDIL